MALKDFTQEYKLDKRTLYACICINQKPGYGMESPVNSFIDDILTELKKAIDNYKDIYIAYVYETDGIMDVTGFEVFNENDRPYYTDLYHNDGDHSMEHIFFMGMELLKRHKKDECRLYMITDEKLPRANNILCKTEYGIEINERYADDTVEIVLCKPLAVGEDLLDEYAHRRL